MIRDFFNFGVEDLIQLLYFIPIYLITITVHEVAHGYAAYKMGDHTARSMGRLTLNPFKHIDIVGFLMLIFFRFGWAKPVPINPRNFKNPKKGMAISALAGPASNFCMAIIGAIIWRIIFVAGIKNNIFLLEAGTMYYTNAFLGKFFSGCIAFFQSFYILNIYFGVFNLLPVPPLDGSRIVSYFLPPNLSYRYAQIERYGFLILIVLMYTNILRYPLQVLAGFIQTGINFVLNLIPFLRV